MSQHRRQAKTQREIGPVGTGARIVLGVLIIGLFGIQGGRLMVIHGRFRFSVDPLSVILGVLVFPAVLLAWQWWRSRRASTQLQATGARGTSVNMLIFFGLILTPYYAPALHSLAGGAEVFYGASMLLAAVKGYAGCEVFAVTNWLLGRNDQAGCLIFSPIDSLERRPKG